MTTRPSPRTFTMVVAGALATTGLFACNAPPDGEGDSVTQSLSADPSAALDPSARPLRGGPRVPGGKPGGRGAGFGPGSGHHGPQDPGWLFDRFDSDGDGKVALAQLPEFKREWLASADTDGDSMLTREEMKAHHDQRRARFLAEADTDSDGAISDAEHAAFRAKQHARRFSDRDANGDGFLTQDEVPDARRWEHMSTADANQDGQLSLEEIQSAVASGRLQPPDRPPHGSGMGHGQHCGGPRARGMAPPDSVEP